ncbi:MAG TPA: hypothetical protein VFI21_05280 [Nocardioides sp.]|nr:hypothetical protein [Nocardioides sp.]
MGSSRVPTMDPIIRRPWNTATAYFAKPPSTEYPHDRAHIFVSGDDRKGRLTGQARCAAWMSV